MRGHLRKVKAFKEVRSKPLSRVSQYAHTHHLICSPLSRLRKGTKKNKYTLRHIHSRVWGCKTTYEEEPTYKLLLGSRAHTAAMVLVAALVVAVLHVHTCDATYSCCSEERRGTVCTLAGSGAVASIDSPNATTAAINGPVAVALYPPHSIVVAGLNECRLRVIHHNGTVSTLAGGSGSYCGYVDSDDPSRCTIQSSHWCQRR